MMDTPNNGKEKPLHPMIILAMALFAIVFVGSLTLLILAYPEVVQFFFGEPTLVP